MKKLLLITAVLTGCSCVVPVKQTFPELPEQLNQQCKELTQIENPTITLSEFLKVVTSNYSLYHECASQVESLLDWYRSQASLYNNVKTK